jgi:hypothetical protein
METLFYLSDGEAHALVPDAKGVAHAYAVAVLPPGGCDAVVRLTRQDTGAEYTVALDGRGALCDCPAARYNPAPCKHETSVRELVAFLAAVARAPEASGVASASIGE